jgi:hypothetical protein
MDDIIKYVRSVNIDELFVVGVTKFHEDGEAFSGRVIITCKGCSAVGTHRDDWDVLTFEEYHGTIPVN